MAEQQVGKAFVVSLIKADGTATMDVSAILQSSGSTDFYTGTVIPLWRAQSSTHSLEVKAVQDMFAKTVGLIWGGEEILECTFDYIPSGATRAEAATCSKIPKFSVWTITNLPVISVGSFTDAYNSGDWIYTGGASISGEVNSEWSIRLPLRRYVGITSPTFVSG